MQQALGERQATWAPVRSTLGFLITEGGMRYRVRPLAQVVSTHTHTWKI